MCLSTGVLALVCFPLGGCRGPHRSEAENLARTYCSACHAFPEPRLLGKQTWLSGVLPQMAPRLGVPSKSLFEEASRNPHMVVLRKAVSDADWELIVGYYRELAPDSLPSQSLPAQPQVDPDFFAAAPFVPRIPSSAIITLLETDSAHERVFVGEAGTNTLRIFDRNRRLLSTLTLGSPPTRLIAGHESVLVLESGILDPNDEPRGRVVQYDLGADNSLRFNHVLIDSLYRPVFFEQFDVDRDGRNELLICEYGDNRGRLALYRHDGSRYQRRTLDPNPGAIRFAIRDLTGDGAPDIVALFAQGDERIVLFVNDAKGDFSRRRLLARFPPVYGSMDLSLHDFNSDGRLDILYVNGDNFDYSRVHKPYHGIRILENEGQNRFEERYFFPVYGAARGVAADFDKDGDLDILTTSNFPDLERHPERAIMFFESTGPYEFQPYAFSVASGIQWNVMTTGDLNKDGWLDIVIGSMYLESVAQLQRMFRGRTLEAGIDPILYFENRMQSKSNERVQ